MKPLTDDMPLVERLREAPMRLLNVGERAEELMREAADEIERLRSVNSMLDAVIADIANELGCAADNEVILSVIDDLKQQVPAPPPEA